MAAGPSDGDQAPVWDVVERIGQSRFDGVGMLGFRDRADGRMDMQVVPHPAVTVVIELGDDGLAVESCAGRRRVGGLVAGLSPGRARIVGRRVECVEVRLSPLAAYPVFGSRSSDFDGAVLDAEDLWGRDAERLRERLAAAAGWEERFALVERFLTDRRRPALTVDPEVAISWQRIVATGGSVRVADLADGCGWSRKRLWSRFSAQIGLSPKRATMLVRFDRAAGALAAGHDVVAVASACGYADQSHLHRDVLTFAGCTPGAFASGVPTEGTFVQDKVS